MQILHYGHTEPLGLIPKRLGVCRPADADTGIVKFTLLFIAKLRQLAKRRTGCSLPGMAQIEMCIEVDYPHSRLRERVQHTCAMGICGFVSAPQNKGAHIFLLTTLYCIA